MPTLVLSTRGLPNRNQTFGIGLSLLVCAIILSTGSREACKGLIVGTTWARQLNDTADVFRCGNLSINRSHHFVSKLLPVIRKAVNHSRAPCEESDWKNSRNPFLHATSALSDRVMVVEMLCQVIIKTEFVAYIFLFIGPAVKKVYGF